MIKINRHRNLLAKENRKPIIDDIINFFEQEKDQRVTMFEAEDLLDLFLRTAGYKIYNKAVNDSKNILNKRIEI